MAIKLYYEVYKNGNLGDVLTKEIFTKIFGVNVEKGGLRESECLGIGSILQHFLYKCNQQTINVWGSGFIEDKKSADEKFASNMNFFAVRGKLTKARIEAMYSKKFTNLTLGDPGLLAPLLINDDNKKLYKLGIIPHFIDCDNPVFKKISDAIEGSVIIDVLGDPIAITKQISQCQTIISTSLHGLIVADSFGIPNQWCEVSHNVVGNGYKFRDYYSVYDINQIDPMNLLEQNFDNSFIDKIIKSYQVDYQKVLQIRDGLIASFPYQNYCQSPKPYSRNNSKIITLIKKILKCR